MKRYVYIGTYTQQGRGQSHRPEGIYIYRFDGSDGSLHPVGAARETQNPSFLTAHPKQQVLYAANELGGGTVSAFTILSEDGSLAFLNSQPTAGAAPCYVSCDPGGRYLMTANYSSGSLAIYPILADGSLGTRSGYVQHAGELGPDPKRQQQPHAHSIRCDPSGRFVLAADLGLDQVLVYRIDDDGKLLSNDPPFGEMPPGSGPRHFEFSSDGRFVYVAGELDSTVTACTWDSQTGTITPFQTLPTLPLDFTGSSTVADIHRTLDGTALYVSNRGHDSLALFAVDHKSGRLEARDFTSTGGQTPRNFGIDPSGAFLYAANQDSDNIVAFHIDPNNGMLKPTGHEIHVPKPVCVLFVDVG